MVKKNVTIHSLHSSLYFSFNFVTELLIKFIILIRNRSFYKPHRYIFRNFLNKIPLPI